jgi:FkbM family methyltransferase
MGILRSIATTTARILPTPVKTFIHNSRAIDNLLRSAYARAVRAGDAAAIETGPMAGIKLRPSGHTSHAHLRGTYELDLLEAIDKLVVPGAVCYDLGASIGYITLLMARRASRVFSFEPSPVALDEIRAHLAANGYNHVEIVPQPVSDSRRMETFAITDNAYGSGLSHNPDSRWKTISVETVVLDEFAESHPDPDFIKIDIEGEEVNALRGARALLARKHPILFCELHSRELARDAAEYLAGFGYRLTTPAGEPFTVPSEVIPGELHIVALPT